MSGSSVAAVNNGTAGLYSYDIASGLTRGCARIAGYFGVSPGDCEQGISNDRLVSAIHPADRERIMQSVGRLLQTGGIFSESYRTVRPSEGEIAVRSVGFCFRDNCGQPVSIVGAIEAEGPVAEDNVDHAIEHALATLQLAQRMRRPTAEYLIALAIEDLGFVLPRSDKH